MRAGLPDFKLIAPEQQKRLTPADIEQLLEGGRAFGDLSTILREGGAVLFPHIGIAVGGTMIAAAVHAALDSGADTVLVLGVLHARTEELDQARRRVADGGDPAHESSWGIQGPGIPGRDDWQREFSLDHFQFLWRAALERKRDARAPRLVLRYPFLAGGRPERLPGIGELEALVGARRGAGERGTMVVATGDLFHHGIAYGDTPDTAREPGAGGLDLARQSIEDGLAFLRDGDPGGYQRHNVTAKSDARDVGQVLLHLLGPLEGRILDLTSEDMTGPYRKPAPSWVAGALVQFRPVS
jgi:hypothetical protein